MVSPRCRANENLNKAYIDDASSQGQTDMHATWGFASLTALLYVDAACEESVSSGMDRVRCIHPGQNVVKPWFKIGRILSMSYD